MYHHSTNCLRRRLAFLLVLVALAVLFPSKISLAASVDEPKSIPVISSPVIEISGNDLIYFGIIVVGILAKQLLDSWSKFGEIKVQRAFGLIAFILGAVMYVGIASQIPDGPITLGGIFLVFQYGVAWQSLVDVGGTLRASPNQQSPKPIT